MLTWYAMHRLSSILAAELVLILTVLHIGLVISLNHVITGQYISSTSLLTKGLTEIYTSYFILYSVNYIIPFILSIILLYASRSLLVVFIYLILEVIAIRRIYNPVIGNLVNYYLFSMLLPAVFFAIILYIGYASISGKEYYDKYIIMFFLNSLANLRKRNIQNRGQLVRILSDTALYLSITGTTLYALTKLSIIQYLFIGFNYKPLVMASLYTYGLCINTLLSLLSLILNRTSPYTYTVIAGVLTPLSWIATPFVPLLMIRSTFTDTTHRKVEKGILLGIGEAKLVYDRIRDVYQEIDQTPLIEGLRRKAKTWYWRSYREPIVIDFDQLSNRHISIFGASGTGKSSLAKKIAIQLYKRYSIPFLILDHHNEYIDLIYEAPSDVQVLEADKISINPLDLEGRSPRERAIELADIIQSIYGLGYIQRNILEELIMKTYERHGIFDNDSSTWSRPPPTFYDVYRTLEEQLEERIIEQNRVAYEKLRAYIRMLLSNIFAETRLQPHILFEKPCIVLLASLPSDQAKALYVDTLMYKLINTMYRIRGEHRLTIIIDEAHILFRRGRSRGLISRLLMESRKYGIGLIVISQQPLDLNESVILNSATRIVFNIREHRNLDYITRSIAGYMHGQKINAIKLAISNLPQHRFVANIGNRLYIVNSEPLVKGLIETA